MNWRAQGFRAWLWQRLSAVYMAVFLLFFVLSLAADGPGNYSEWRAWIGQPVMMLATAIFFFSLLVHSWVGVRDIIIDYVHLFAVRLLLLVLVGGVLLAMGIWLLRVLFLATL